MSRTRFCLVFALLLAALPCPLNAVDSEEQPSDQATVADSTTSELAERVAKNLGLDGSIDHLLLIPDAYHYQGMGRRDLFVSLVEEGDGIVDPNARPGSKELRVVGILWAENDRFALVETGDGKSLLIREGSVLGDGTVLSVLPDRVVVHITQYGTSHNVTLPLEQGGSFNESPRSRRH